VGHEAAAGSDKPKGAPGIRGWQRPRAQRTRRWSKALRSRLRAPARETATARG